MAGTAYDDLHEETTLNCTLCKQGTTKRGLVTVTLERSGTVVVVRDVPADVCQNCQEYYLDEPVATRVYAQANDAVARRSEVEIVRYAA